MKNILHIKYLENKSKSHNKYQLYVSLPDIKITIIFTNKYKKSIVKIIKKGTILGLLLVELLYNKQLKYFDRNNRPTVYHDENKTHIINVFDSLNDNQNIYIKENL